MTSADTSFQGLPVNAWSQRLVGQLQLLSEVTEQLTYRLIELEERVGEGERSLTQLHQEHQGPEEVPAAMETWLEETEQRLGRVESLLRGAESRGVSGSRVLQAVAAPVASLQQDLIDEESLEGDDPVPGIESQDHPFVEDEEQLFLDEQQIA